MYIYDMHVHAHNTPANPAGLLARLEEAGMYGACIFSHNPEGFLLEKPGISFEARMAELKAWTKGYEDRLFPVLWVHPDDDNVIENIRRAADEGVAAFKIICNNFYIYEEKPMAMLREMARLGKPVFFHSGILWDGQVSSAYNRPLNWEALLKIDGLRFSMGHCSWPWIDECIALYGKFLNAMIKGNTAEMFFDTTPGTPEIYRRELFTKLYALGYDVGNNVMFGTDTYAHDHNTAWSKKWLEIDRKIMDDLGVSRAYREKLYGGNLLRFLGKTDAAAEKNIPIPDDNRPWSPVNPEAAEIIEKWYKKLNFPKCCDKPFYEALRTIPVSDAITVKKYDHNCPDGKRNLLSYLFFCEETARRYAEAGIPEEILIDTLRDIPRWTAEWSNVKGELHLSELGWLEGSMDLRLFKLGRLQFCRGKAECDVPQYGIKKDDPVLVMHIPADGKLDIDACRASMEMAKEFYAKYFPDYTYKAFTCHSWLLDDSLKAYLPETSNIIRFGELFTKVHADDSDALLRYIFRWDTNEMNLPHAVCNSEFSRKIKAAAMRGETFHETYGVIPV